MATKIDVKIGTFERSYVMAQTTAPKEYDGFGTLEIYTSAPAAGENGRDPDRYVLCDVDHVVWQEGRYRSGLYTFEIPDEDISSWAQDNLFKRMTDPAAYAVMKQLADEKKF